MSTIITSCYRTRRKKLVIYAPSPGCFVCDTDLDDTIIDITGDASAPFICGVRLSLCTVIADNMKAFQECYFDDDCELLIKDMPLVVRSTSTAETINHNRVKAP